MFELASMGNTKMSETMPYLQGNGNPLRVQTVTYWPWLKTRWRQVLSKGKREFLWESGKGTKSDLRIWAEPSQERHTEWSERQTGKLQDHKGILPSWTTTRRSLLCTPPLCFSPAVWVTFQNRNLIIRMPPLKTLQWFPIIVRISDQAMEPRRRGLYQSVTQPHQPSLGSPAQPQYFFSATRPQPLLPGPWDHLA